MEAKPENDVAKAEATQVVMTMQDQKATFEKLSKMHSKNKEFAYIISLKWLDSFKSYIGYADYSYYNVYRTHDKKKEKNNEEIPPPGPITNDDILEPKENFLCTINNDDMENFIIKDGLKENYEFKLIDNEMWNFLYGIYGGTPIKRQKNESKYFYYDSYDIFFRKVNLLILPPKSSFSIDKIMNSKPLYISRQKLVKDLKEKIVNIFSDKDLGSGLKSSTKLRLWIYESNERDLSQGFIMEHKKYFESIHSLQFKQDDNDYEYNYNIEIKANPIDLSDSTKIEDFSITDNNLIILEQSDEEGYFIFKRPKNCTFGLCHYCNQKRILYISCLCKLATYCSLQCMEKDKKFHAPECPELEKKLFSTIKENCRMGATGLQNLGNTCYMNSGLQCVSNTWPLAYYFLNGFHEKEVNVTNPLGKKGKLARAYHKLLRQMYYDDAHSVAPSEVKSILGQVNSIFSGFSQNDSHELISELLDGLHEDLNRIIKKPYIETIEKKSEQPIDEFAQICWINHLRRNQSIIVDLFHGQFLNHVTCPDCKNTSYRADPYASIQLPIPRKQKFDFPLYFVPFSIEGHIIKKTIYLSDSQSFAEIRVELAKEFGVPLNSFIIARIYKNAFRQVFDDSDFPDTTDLRGEAISMFEIDPEIINLTTKSNEMSDVKSPEITNPTPSSDKKDDKNILNLGSNLGDYIPVPISFETKYTSAYYVQELIVPRVILINKNMTLADIHLYIFKCFYGFLKNSEEISKSNNLADAFNKLELNNKDSKVKPYNLSYVNSLTRGYYQCLFCHNTNCIQCQIPFEEKSTILEELSKLNLPHLLSNKSIYVLDEKRKYKEILEFKILYSHNIENSKQKIEKVTTSPSHHNKNALNIYDMFESFIKEKSLDEKNRWFCTWCKEPKKAKKKMMIYNTPPILILQLSRFKSEVPSTNYGGYHSHYNSYGGKFDEFIEYPIKDLDLTNYCVCKTQEMKYDLFAVSEHFGGLGGGHYTAHVYNHHWKKWFSCNDSSCHESNDGNSIVSSSAYVLFYKRKDIGEITPEFYNKIRKTLKE